MNVNLPERWLEWAEERAAILEHEAGVPRADAERLAVLILQAYLQALATRGEHD